MKNSNKNIVAYVQHISTMSQKFESNFQLEMEKKRQICSWIVPYLIWAVSLAR
jgi:hypothetical protein